MARLVSYKLTSDSKYSTFKKEEEASTFETFYNENDEKNKDGCCKSTRCKCCCLWWYGSSETISDDTDIEFALIKYAQVKYLRQE